MKILAVGPMWRGSNAGGLFRALSRKGCLMEVIDEFYFISLQTKRKLTKIFERLIRDKQADEYNNAIRKKIDIFRPDVVLVYKGAFVRPATLDYAKQKGCMLALFYPDVSMTAHGPNIPLCLPKYDIAFTTKTFAVPDLKGKYGVTNAYFIPHGFDPEIHRKLTITPEYISSFGCDASFIGTYSPKKEAWLAELKKAMPDIDLKIWGEQWFKASDETLKSCIQHSAVMGDLYAIAIQCSKINLGILSEKVSGAPCGDFITSRTFHIPGSGGFMLHERNEESLLYFKENLECGFFDGPAELAEQVKRYLADEQLTNKIKEAGYIRAQKDHSLDSRAEEVLANMNKHF